MGKTEPLGPGDMVRILYSTKIELVGIITQVIRVDPPGLKVRLNGVLVKAAMEVYSVIHPAKHVYARSSLWKLPPDYFETLDKAEAFNALPSLSAIRKRLQIQDK